METGSETGIHLTLIDGEWTAPCGCTFHYFDGKPSMSDTMDGKRVLPDGKIVLVGKVAPHWHPCAVHA